MKKLATRRWAILMAGVTALLAAAILVIPTSYLVNSKKMDDVVVRNMRQTHAISTLASYVKNNDGQWPRSWDGLQEMDPEVSECLPLDFASPPEATLSLKELADSLGIDDDVYALGGPLKETLSRLKDALDEASVAAGHRQAD